MLSKLGRFIPLAISGMVFIGFLLNFKVFGLMFNNHYRYGAGVISVRGVSDILYPESIANIYLHFSLLFLFAIGILLFAFHKKIGKGNYLILSISMLLIFLIRPLITLVNMALTGWDGFDYFIFPTVKGQLIGIDNNMFGSFFSIKSYVTGLLLLLLLIANLILAFIRKGSPAHASHGHVRQMQAPAVRPMPIPVQPQGAPTSMTQELERLQHMYNSGALTEEEFATAKKRVLGN